MTNLADSQRTGVFAFLGEAVRVGVGRTRAAMSHHHDEVELRESKVREAIASEKAAFEQALSQFDGLCDQALEGYRPVILQADIDAVPRGRHEMVAAILEKETQRIIDVLAPVMRTAGFPLGSSDKNLIRAMENEWMKAKAPFHAKAFGGLYLSRRFGIHQASGLLEYEPVEQIKAHYVRYVGNWTGQTYRSRPILLS